MELQGSVTIPATPERVWQALHDPDVLRLCIPGCEEIRWISAQELHARLMLKMGPVRANFVGKVRLTDARPPFGYTLDFEGSGGSAGFARGSSAITVTAVAQGRHLDYTAQASVAGKLGQIGGRLMDACARQLADQFFKAFQRQLTDATTEAKTVALARTATPEPWSLSAQTAGSAAAEPGRGLVRPRTTQIDVVYRGGRLHRHRRVDGCVLAALMTPSAAPLIRGLST